jgi:hypothetical protein
MEANPRALRVQQQGSLQTVDQIATRARSFSINFNALFPARI